MLNTVLVFGVMLQPVLHKGVDRFCFSSYSASLVFNVCSCSEDKMHSPRDFHILFVPRRSMLCEQRLKEQGVLGSFINIDEYILDLIPYDGDLLSMESEGAFRVS